MATMNVIAGLVVIFAFGLLITYFDDRSNKP